MRRREGAVPPATAPSEGADDERRSIFVRAAAFLAALPAGLKVALVVALVFHAVALSWGMPASDAWDNDGVAPRDILPGLAATFSPGDYYTYPPLQLAILGVLTLPVTLTAVVRAGTTSVPAVVREILAPGYMTVFAMTARVICVVQSLGVVLALALLARELAGADRARGQRAALFTALFASLGAPFTYYSHTSNLDVPYLFWGSIAALFLARAVARSEPRLLRRAALFAAMGAATKDQAYALFLFAAPLTIAAWVTFEPWARKNTRLVARESAIAAAITVASVLFLDGALFNPTGFRARVRFLSGPASQDFATYSRDLHGRVDNVLDIGRQFLLHYPAFAVAFVVFGLLATALAVRGQGRATKIAALVPLAVALSFTLGFNLTARRVEERFTLPHVLFASVYAGYGLELAWSARLAVARWAGRAACALALALAAYNAARVDLTMLFEPRYQTEAYLREHARGESVEVYGLNVYLPRFPAEARVSRIGSSPPDRRNPMPGVTEIQAPLSAIGARRPRFVVVSLCYAWRYLPRDMSADSGRIFPVTQHRDASNDDATELFRGLFEGRIGYHVAHVAELKDTWFDPYSIHGSLSCPVFTFERDAP